MTAPEKIAIKPCNPYHGDDDWYIVLTKGGTEYTRSDLIAALEAAAEERGRIAGLREAAGLSPYDSDGALSSIFDHKIFVKIDAILALTHTDAIAALSRIEAQAEARVLAVVRQAHETLIEINPNNYTHDEVVEANDAVVEAIFLLADLIGETHGKLPEWWEKRRAMIANATEAADKGGV